MIVTTCNHRLHVKLFCQVSVDLLLVALFLLGNLSFLVALLVGIGMS